MSEHDFLHALKEELPEGFAQELKAKLEALDEPARNKRTDNHRTFWTVAAASVVTMLLGVILLVSRVPQLQMLVIAPPVPAPSFTQHDQITSANINQLQPFATLGNGTINQIHMMPSGEHLLVAASTGLFLHDLDNLHAEPQQITSEAVWFVDVDAQGNIYGLIAPFYRYISLELPQTIARWDAMTGEQRVIMDVPDGAYYIDDFSVKPDGSEMIVRECTQLPRIETIGWSCITEELNWYDTLTGNQIASYQPTIEIMWGSTYAVADDWSFMAYATDIDERPNWTNYALKLTNIATRETHTVLTLGTNPVRNLEFSADGQYLLMMTDYPEQQFAINDVLALWELEEPVGFAYRFISAAPSRVTSENGAFLNVYGFSPDNSTVFAASQNGLLKFLLSSDAPATLEAIPEGRLTNFSGHFEIAIEPDGKTLYSLRAGNIILKYDVDTLEIVDTLTRYNSEYSQAFQFTDDGTRVAISSPNGIPTIWTIDTDNPTDEPFLPGGQLQSVMRFAFSHDGSTVAYQLWHDTPVWIQRLGDSSTAQMLGPYVNALMQFLPDGTLFGMRENSGIVRYAAEDYFSGEPNPQVTMISGLGGNLGSTIGADRVAVSSDGQWAAIAMCPLEPSCLRTEIAVWNLQTEERVTTMRDAAVFNHPGTIAFSPDNRLLAFAFCRQPLESVSLLAKCDDSEVRLYTLESMLTYEGSSSEPPLPPLVTVTGFEELPTHIAFHPIQQDDGSWLIAITEWNTRTQLWRVHEDGTAEVLRILDEVRQPVAFDPTGGLMFTTADTAQTEVWGVPLP
jgi:WD40 repeat protein